MKDPELREFSNWVKRYEKIIKPEFDAKLVDGVLIPANLESELLQHYMNYRINKSNQQMIKVTWVLTITSMLMLISSIIISILR